MIIDKNTVEKKFDNFIQENRMTQLNRDPTDMYQKQIQQTIKKCKISVDKQAHKYPVNIKPTVPKLNIYIKTHKTTECTVQRKK